MDQPGGVSLSSGALFEPLETRKTFGGPQDLGGLLQQVGPFPLEASHPLREPGGMSLVRRRDLNGRNIAGGIILNITEKNI